MQKKIRIVKDAYTADSWLQWSERAEQTLELCHVDDHNYWRIKYIYDGSNNYDPLGSETVHIFCSLFNDADSI
jgi:hypothetical protein